MDLMFLIILSTSDKILWVDFSIFTGFENVDLMIELDRCLSACRDTKHPTENSK